MKIIKLVFSIIMFLLFWGNCKLYAQISQEAFNQLINEDSTEVNSVAIYPQNIRDNIFKASQHPDGIIKLDVLRKNSNQVFKKRVAAFSKADQGKIWNISRYNNLIHHLVQSSPAETNLQKILSQYPAEIHTDAEFFISHHRELLNSLDSLSREFDLSFSNIVSEYPPEDQTAFQNLLNAPEAISLLNQNLNMTIRLGDIYKSNPTFLKQQFDSLNLVLAEQKAKETEEWKQEIKNNPDAEAELKQSANEYAKELGSDDQVYNKESPEAIENHTYTPYPYWCGYPWWYESDYWYPYPYWYHWGFYNWNNTIIWIGTPSWYFVRWHFHRYRHCYNYPHLSNVLIDHYYYGPRRPASRHRVQVGNWINRNEKYLPKDFKTNRGHRIDRIKELGKSEIDRRDFNKKNSRTQISRDEFSKQHSGEYPNLNPRGNVRPQNRATPKTEVKKPLPQQKEIPRTENRKVEITPVRPNPTRKEPFNNTKPPVREQAPVTPLKRPQTPKQRAEPVERPHIAPREVPQKPIEPKRKQSGFDKTKPDRN